MIRAVYFHSLEGRMRIHLAGVKGSPAKALEITDRLSGYEGIGAVSANPFTGNVLITYDSHRISQRDILGKLEESGYLGKQEYVSLNTGVEATGNSEWGTTIVRFALEALSYALVL